MALSSSATSRWLVRWSISDTKLSVRSPKAPFSELPAVSSALVRLPPDSTMVPAMRWRDHVEVEDEAGVALGDRFADALGIGDHGFALAGQFLDQGAHARFIVGIGAFERGDLVVDHHFEFAGARQGALEAIAQRVDFAAHGLADRGDLLGRGGFGLGEADRGLGHGGRGVAQVLRAADQRGDGEEAEDRNDGEGDAGR